MAEADKRQLGMHDLSLGVHHNLTLGVTYVPPERVATILSLLDALMQGQLAVETYRSLLGSLINVAFLANMSRSRRLLRAEHTIMGRARSSKETISRRLY